METFSDDNRVASVMRKIGMDYSFAVASEGHRGGLAPFCREGIQVQIVNSSNHFIDLQISLEEGAPSWHFTGFYGCPERTRRRESWDILKSLSLGIDQPWLVMGDFNDLIFATEKRGRVLHPPWLLRGFRDSVWASGLRNFAFKGYQCWRGSPNWVEEKLDRTLVSKSWLDIFGAAEAESLEGAPSDHLAIFIKLIPA
ncbi:unnamed protein product [Cuscuta europaea]|uniref:Endonuclease/exonuclease/phosphatase domain-containing protein n=1 Tax=Cuscuta europaea TaxID=41803 RepID=A0A9P0ZVY8_CUSEU|nr:unnamed protein product [Cuscuta europaea]